MNELENAASSFHDARRGQVGSGRPRRKDMNSGDNSGAIVRDVDPTAQPFGFTELRTQGFDEPLRHARPGFARTHHDDSPDRLEVNAMRSEVQFLVFDPNGFIDQQCAVNRLRTRLPDVDGISDQALR